MVFSFNASDDITPHLLACSRRGYYGKTWFINKAIRFYLKYKDEHPEFE